MSAPLYAGILDAAPDAILLSDFNGILSLWNKGAERLYGWKQEEALNRRVYELLQTGFPVSLQEASDTVRRGQEWRGELVHITRGRDKICVDSRWSPQLDEKGTIVGILEINRDITGLKAAWRAVESDRLAVGARLSLALVSARAGIWERDLRTNRATWSNELWELFGLEPYSCEPCYDAWMKIIHPDDREMVARVVGEATNAGTELQLEFRRLGHNGEIRWLMTRAQAVRDASGVPIAYTGVILDITDHKQAELALERSENHFRMLVEQSPQGIFLTDEKGRCIDVNGAGIEMLGYTKAELLERSIADVVVTTDVPRIDAKVARLADNTVTRSDWQFRRKDGSVFRCEVAARQLSDGRLQAIVNDLTEWKRAEEELRQKNRQVSELLHISQKLTSKLDLHALFAAASASLRGGVSFDVAAVVLPESNGLVHIHVLDSPSLSDAFGDEAVIPLGRLLEQQVPPDGRVRVLRHEELRAIHDDLVRQLLAAGVRSACCTLLRLGDRPTGSLWLGSAREDAFPVPDRDWVRQVSVLLSIALDNSRAYEEIARLKNKLAEEKQNLEQELHSELHLDEIIGNSPALKHALDQAHLVAETDATVLLLGETGTGKGLIARTIHRVSKRNSHSFVRLNCAAIPVGLLESELFGHEKGAFTHATSRKEGRLELADQGTLFLDEIGEMPLEVQPKLLRVLQDREFERLGSTHTTRVNFRLIAATNRDLLASVAEGEFRSDLFYRLNVFPIQLPPLRERREDIPQLVTHFAHKHARRMKREIHSIPSPTVDALTRWHWPGNIRELDNFVERSVILSNYGVLNAPLAELESASNAEAGGGLEQMERDAIVAALRKSSGVISGPNGAAARLGLKRTTLQSRLSRMGIDPREYNSRGDTES